MKPRRSNPSDGTYWYAIAVLAAVATGALVYQSRREMSNPKGTFFATAVVLRDAPPLNDAAKARICSSILNRANLDEMIRRMGLSADGGIAVDLSKAAPESAETLVSRLDVEIFPETDPSRCRVAITCSDPHRPERAIRIANYLAEHYCRNSQLRVHQKGILPRFRREELRILPEGPSLY